MINNASIQKIEMLNCVNGFCADIVSQMNILFIHYDKLDDIVVTLVSKEKLSPYKTKYQEINALLHSLKQTFQDHYLKLNENLKKMVIFYLRFRKCANVSARGMTVTVM